MVRRRLLGIAMVSACFLVACGSSRSAPSPTSTTARVDLRDAQGTIVGTAILSASAVTLYSPAATASALAAPVPTAPGVSPGTTGVHFDVDIISLSPGSHGFHIDANGVCDAPSFQSSGPHFNPFNRQHGLQNPQGPHAGDLPNLPVGMDGKARLQFSDALVTLDTGQPNSLKGPNGSSLVVDSRVDNGLSNPDGNSGGHIACGVIYPSSGAAAVPTETPAEASPTAQPPSTPTAKSTSTPTPTPEQRASVPPVTLAPTAPSNPLAPPTPTP
jgi:Cu-Zn family superoxide dismutase